MQLVFLSVDEWGLAPNTGEGDGLVGWYLPDAVFDFGFCLMDVVGCAKEKVAGF